MKYQKFIIILAVFVLLLAGCRRNEPTEEELSGAVPEAFNYAAGSLGFPVLVNNVGIEVQEAGLLAVQEASSPGYIHLLLQLSVTNESDSVVVPPSMTLVDDHNNAYTAWQTEVPYEDQLTRMPLSVETGEGATGHLVYIVPTAATQDNLRLRWESDLHQSRIDVYLGPLGQRTAP